jgi:organic radical activating enzyme
MINDFLRDVELEIHSKPCNLDCPLCLKNNVDYQHLMKTQKYRPLEDIKKQLDDFIYLKSVCLASNFTEPTFHPQILDIIEYLQDRNVTIELYTNANTHTPEWWAKLGEMSSEKLQVIFTICGSTQELHEKYRVNSDLQQILDNHEAFKKSSNYKNDFLQHIMFTYNQDDFHTDSFTNIRKRFSNECNINTLPYGERFNFIKEIPKGVEIDPLIKEKYDIIVNVGKSRFGKDNVKIRCKSFETKFSYIDVDGNMYPCFLYNMYKGKWDGSYDDILEYKYDFCYECEKLTCDLLNKNELENMS